MAMDLEQQENADYTILNPNPSNNDDAEHGDTYITSSSDQEPEGEQTMEPASDVTSGQQTVYPSQQQGKKKGAKRFNLFDTLRDHLLEMGMDKEHADKFVHSYKARLMKDVQSKISGSESSKPNINEAMGESTRFTTNDPFLTSFDSLTRSLAALKDLPEGPDKELLLNLMIGHYFNQLQPMMYNQYYAQMPHGRGNGHHNGHDDGNTSPITKMAMELLEFKRATMMARNIAKVFDKLFPDEDSESNSSKEDKFLTAIKEIKDMQKQFMDAITKMKEDENKIMMQKMIEAIERMNDNLVNMQYGSNTGSSTSTAKDPIEEVTEITQKTKAVVDSLADLGLVKKTKDEEGDLSDKMIQTLEKSKKLLEASGRYRVEELPLTEERLAEIAKKKALDVLNNMDENTLQDLVEKRGYTLQKKTLTREEVDTLIQDITKKVEEETRKKVEAEHKIGLANNILAKAMDYVGPAITDMAKTLVGSSLQTVLSAKTPPTGSNVNNNVSVSPNTNPSSNVSTNTNPSPPTPGIQAKVTTPATNVPPPSASKPPPTASKAKQQKQQKTDELQSLKDEEINEIQQLLR
jgi:hypothetical protein